MVTKRRWFGVCRREGRGVAGRQPVAFPWQAHQGRGREEPPDGARPGRCERNALFASLTEAGDVASVPPQFLAKASAIVMLRRKGLCGTRHRCANVGSNTSAYAASSWPAVAVWSSAECPGQHTWQPCDVVPRRCHRHFDHRRQCRGRCRAQRSRADPHNATAAAATVICCTPAVHIGPSDDFVPSCHRQHSLQASLRLAHRWLSQWSQSRLLMCRQALTGSYGARAQAAAFQGPRRRRGVPRPASVHPTPAACRPPHARHRSGQRISCAHVQDSSIC